ncbi:ATP-binding protein [Actinoplanes rectilineatus]|uniref:ATP-binding protein n=1 Tax=Actinoplanes rectilineatus TaxID=113571 RepID=UPI0005F2EBE3|nr:AAA family ATPase [Actinoplanes rectilineatus]
MAGGAGSARMQILGPLRIERGGVDVAPGPRQQALLLAVLLARTGQPVSVSELIDLIWEDRVPPSAVNVIQKHVGALRRLLEPDLAYRDSGSYLRLHGNGYLLAADREVVDLVAFRALVEEASAGLDRERALDRYDEGLRLWRGPAGDTLGSGATARRVFAELDEEFLTACLAATTLASSLGQPQRMLPHLRLAASMAPMHEPVQAAFASALAASGQRAEAQALLTSVRDRLAEQLGIDPGPALRAVERLVGDGAPAPAAVTTPAGRARRPGALVGRHEELTALRQGVERVLAGGTGLAVVEGEPGVGKTRLIEEASAEAERGGARVVWGRCLEGDGTPAMWPWVQVVVALLDDMPAAARPEWKAGELGRLVVPRDISPGAPLQPDSGLQLRLFEQATELVAVAASRRPVVVVIDDLQWADLASLDLFGHLGARLPAGAALIGAFRTHAPTPGSELTRIVDGVSRTTGHRRVRLGPLAPKDVTELVSRVTGRTPVAGVSRDIHARTGGNPFFVRELSRLLAADGGELVAEDGFRAAVPATVRDVVQDRMAGLDDTALGLLRIAALIGREVDVELLARVAGLEVPECRRHLEPVEELGLIGPAPGNPLAVWFTHDLVRESVARTTPPRSVPRLHLRVADAIEDAEPGGEPIAERLAHHLWSAGPLAEPSRTATALLHAGRRAAAKSAFDVAERHLRLAARVARGSGLAEIELATLSQLTMVLGMQKGYVGAPPDILERSEDLARGLGRELEATSLLFTRWTGYSQGMQIEASGRLARRLREGGEVSADPMVRIYGWLAWAVHQWEIGAIGESLRHLRRVDRAVAAGAVRAEAAPLLRDQKLLAAGMLGLMATLHDDVPDARARFARMRADAGDDPYAVTFWATFVALSGAVAGDPEWALTAAEDGIAVDPELAFEYLGTTQRLAWWWGTGMLGRDPDRAAAEIERIIEAHLLEPPRSSVAAWYAALAELHLTIDALDQAGAALDRAEQALERYGQRYAEGLILALRARLARDRGAPADVVEAAADRVKALAAEGEGLLFLRRVTDLLRSGEG